MIDYYLTDIHFHTDLSFDAYQNEGGINFNLNQFAIEETSSSNPVKLIIKTDHNIFNYSKYVEYKSILSNYDIVLLPGIEINAENKVHWIFAFDDKCLEKERDNNKIGNILDEKIKEYFNYLNVFPDMATLRTEQQNVHRIDKFISILNENDISFLAIPHLNKASGFYEAIKKNPDLLSIVESYLNESIINGFESKNYDDFFRNSIKTTEKYIEELEIDIETGKAIMPEEILRRKKHCKMMKNLSSMVIKNSVSSIYGSDFHGKIDSSHPNYETLKNNLFYMKSERSFEGLKLALLDQESRVFTIDRFNSSRKDNSNWIKKIKLSINGKICYLNLGDSLNSIIGARGSGKSYLINSLLNTNKYSNSNIQKQIQLLEIEYADGTKGKCLNDNKYDYLGQRNAKIDDGTSIYNVLSDAPYNVDSFKKFISENNSATIVKSKNNIKDIINLLNCKLESCKKIYEIIDKGFDNSFIKDYCKYSSELINEAQINNVFVNANDFYEKQINKKNDDNEKIQQTIDLLKSTNTNLNTISKIFEFTNISDEEKDEFEIFKNETNNIIKILERIKNQIKYNIRNIKEVYFHTKRIEENIKKNMTNRELSYENSFENFKGIIRDIKENINVLSEGNNDLESILKDRIENIEEIQFNLGNRKCKLRTVYFINFNELSKGLANNLLKNYKKEIEIKKIINGIMNFESLENINNLIENIDKRIENVHLNMPENILLNKNVEICSGVDEEYKNISQMSPGERSSLLLDLIMNADKSRILIIDQPEDDLDNETVYKTIVTKLRELKFRRQIIVVTHNANICINGDSDSIIICENIEGNFNYYSDTMESTNLYNYYSTVNNLRERRILEISSHILDGGKEALRKRIKVIGQKDILFKEDD